MSKSLRKLISQNRRRWVDDDFDLDLSYVTDRIIAMSFPAPAADPQRIFRNSLRDVKRFLDVRHPGAYKVYNLCSEGSKQYPSSLFDDRCARFSISDHSPPSFAQIRAFCVDVHDWLKRCDSHVAVVHCKAGKGRTGTLIACYLLYSMQCASADEAMAVFARARTLDGRGITIPSQIRYIRYFESMLAEKVTYDEVDPLLLHKIIVEGVDLRTATPGQLSVSVSRPHASNTGSIVNTDCALNSDNRKKRVFHSTFSVQEAFVEKDVFSFEIRPPLELRGDVRLDVRSCLSLMRCDKKFDFSAHFNTFFVEFSADESTEFGNVSLRSDDLDGLVCGAIGVTRKGKNNKDNSFNDNDVKKNKNSFNDNDVKKNKNKDKDNVKKDFVVTLQFSAVNRSAD